MSGWDRVFTFYNANSANQWFPMRCVRTKDRSYIWNVWSDGQTQYRAENKELLALMQRTGDPLAEAFARRDNPEILSAARRKLMDEYQRPPRTKAKANKRKETRR